MYSQSSMYLLDTRKITISKQKQSRPSQTKHKKNTYNAANIIDKKKGKSKRSI
jgi:hypothetical protein